MSEEIIDAVPSEQIPEAALENMEETRTADQARTEQAPEADAPVQETPSQDAPVQETPAQDAPLLGENYLQELSGKSLKEIIEVFEKLVDRGDQQEMYKFADGIKAAFYKALKRDKVAAGFYPAPDESTGGDAPQAGEASGDAPEQEEDQTVSENPFAQVERGFKALYARYRSLRNAYLAQVEKNKEENLAAKLRIIEELKNLVENQEDLSKTFPAFRALQARWREVGPVPAKNVKDIYDTYQHNVEKFYDFVKINNELRDLDFKKNLEIKENLCRQAEELIAEDNVVEAFMRLQKLHEEWKELGPVDKEHRESIWERFKEATAQINRRHQTYFESLKDVQKENLARKTALCEKAEEVAGAECADSGSWNAATRQIEDLQKEWKTIGYASRKENQKIYDRFRAACDRFFERKRVYYTEFKDQMTRNYEEKVSLCRQAEELSASTDWKNATDAIIALQKRWKETGPVSRKKSDAIWNRFRAACDAFFDNKEKNYGGVDPQYVENLRKKEAIIGEVNSYECGGGRNDLDAMRGFIRSWNEIGFVPFKAKDRIQDAFRSALDAKFPEYRSGSDSPRRRSDRGQRVVDTVKSEREKLLQKYHKIESEIATYENNMGFFASSKNADALISGITKKIEAAKAELAGLVEKIKSVE